MASTEQDTKKPEDATAEDQAQGENQAGDDQDVQELDLDIKVETKSACERHVVVLISREDVDRYFNKQYDELMPKAEVPGFRPGRAPRKLVESKFRAQVSDQVKGGLLLDCMNQVNETQEFSAISEPDFDFDSVVVPEEGPLRFEFDIEVRPEFDMPDWKGLKIERPVRDIDKNDVDEHLKRVLADYSDLVPVDRAVESDDLISVSVTCSSDGKEVSNCEELEINVKPSLSFPDAMIEGFDKHLIGAKVGDKKTVKTTIVNDADNADLRGKEVELEFEVLDVKAEELPEINEEILSALGGFDDEGSLRDAIRSELERQLEYRQGQQVRQQITSLLTESASWELPQDLLKRQANRELERAMLELRASGFDQTSMRTFENELRQNSMARTETALKEHFILESIAESENVEETAEDYDREIALIASQQGDSPRRVRARLEKRGQMDSLRNQIIERKVIELIKKEAKFQDKKFEFGEDKTEAVDYVVSGSSLAAIPDAKYADGGEEKLPEKADRT